MELLSAVAWRLGESVQAEATPQKFRRLNGEAANEVASR
jgi:hypothetical protein